MSDPYFNPLQGLRTWNVDDPAFVGLVVISKENRLGQVLRALLDLKLGSVQLVDWYNRQIIFHTGATIKVRTITGSGDAYLHMGLEYWTICFLDFLPFDAYQTMKSRVRPPATHWARKNGMLSREALAEKKAAEQRWREALTEKAAKEALDHQFKRVTAYALSTALPFVPVNQINTTPPMPVWDMNGVRVPGPVSTPKKLPDAIIAKIADDDPNFVKVWIPKNFKGRAQIIIDGVTTVDQKFG